MTKKDLSVPEVARRLGISGEAVYQLIFDGDLLGEPDTDGVVRVAEAELSRYLQATAPR